MKTTASFLLLFVLTPASAFAADAAHGKALFLAKGCSECHGTSGEGSAAAPRLAPNPLPLEAVRRQLRTPAQRMPAYSAQLVSDTEIEDMVAYLQTVKPGKTLSQIPALNDNFTPGPAQQ